MNYKFKIGDKVLVTRSTGEVIQGTIYVICFNYPSDEGSCCFILLNEGKNKREHFKYECLKPFKEYTNIVE